MRGARSLVGVVLAGAVLAGCGGGTPDVDPTTHGPEPRPTAVLDQVAVPPAYDAARGWQQVLGWVPDDAATVPVTVAPLGGTVALMTRAASGGYTVQARDAGTGAVDWTSRPWKAPAPMTDPVSGDSTGGIPDLVTVRQDGREYVVAYAHGTQGKDALHDGREVVALAVYAADGSGAAVAPLREVTVPVQDGDGTLQVRDGGHGLLLTWTKGMTNMKLAAAVDVATGRTTRYDHIDALMPQCEHLACAGSTVTALTPDGPVVELDSGGFGVPGVWFGPDHAPKGAATGGTLFGGVNGTVSGAVGGHLVARWSTHAGVGDIWAVHDTTTGAVEASVTCALSSPEESEVERYGYTAALSASGRYLVAGAVAFDLHLKRGFCLAGDGDRNLILLESVTDDGTAYGTIEDGTGTDPSDDTPPNLARYSLTTGRTTSLPAGTQMPYTPLPHTAMFLTHDTDNHVRVSVIASR